jgi:hypothetical protein
VFQVFSAEWSIYSAESAEKAIAVLAPLARALGPEGRQILSNSAIECIKVVFLDLTMKFVVFVLSKLV